MSASKTPQVAFRGDWTDLTPFSDLGPVAKVDDLVQMSRQLSGGMMGGAEKTVGSLEMVDATLISLLAQHSRAVCRVSVPPGHVDFNGKLEPTGWTGTGFLVAPNILLTNYHVLNTPQIAAAAMAEFDYQVTGSDLLNGPPDADPSAVRFRLLPDRLFITSKFEDFDYAFVWIESEAAERFGTIEMTRGSFLVKPTEPTFILHHPDGQPKKASLDDTEVLSLNSSFLLYAADTQYGSSGAPVFDKRGRLAALHHAWWPVQRIKDRFPGLTGRLNDGGVTDIVNEGIKLAAIAIDLERRAARGGTQAKAAETVLAAFRGSDTLTGMFGGLGRSRDAIPLDEDGQEMAGYAYEKTVSVYRGTGEDIDIGAWNIEWLNRDHDDDRRLNRVAMVIADLNLDIWALSEVSPPAVEALLEVLRKTFKQEFKAAFSEPNASTGKQSTAIIWRPNVLECTREDWPDAIDKVLRADSRDDDLPYEAVHGKIFNRYPGLFRVRLKSDEKEFDFYLVPLHLKAKREGSLRRELASKALSYAVQQMVTQYQKDNDWIILGDVNATLKSGDFDPLRQGGFTALSAQDEENGGFTYLKAPYKSLIDNIFVSDSLSPIADEDDFHIIETHRTVSRFIREVSDHLPIALRLSLGKLPDAESPAQAQESHNADDIFNAMLTHAGLPAPAAAHAATAARAVPHAAPGPAPSDWVWERRDKFAFFRDNAARLRATLARVNADWAQTTGPAAFQPLTMTDVAVVYMAEAGVSNGVVDPDYVHSNGEVGLFPLPDRVAFWVGGNPPAYNRPMPLGLNISTYLAYLCALRNKTVKMHGAVPLYPGLFREQGIAGVPEREAKLLAGIVHGYFWSGNFASGTVPFSKILSGFAADDPVDRIMAGTGYVHAGTSILVNRQRNIDLAVRHLI